MDLRPLHDRVMVKRLDEGEQKVAGNHRITNMGKNRRNMMRFDVVICYTA
jgi:co-chaperonin GroES (HSP10)